MIVLRVVAGVEAARSLTEIKLTALEFPGEHELALAVGDRHLCLGPIWQYDASPECLSALSEFGELESTP